MTDIQARDRLPGVRTIARSIRTSPFDVLRGLALSERQDQVARDANEWYWVSRFGHPLVDHINIKGFMSLRSIYAMELTKGERGKLTASDLDVLARSQSPAAREVAAGHKFCPPKALGWLAEDSDSGVRRAVGHNPATPADVIASMQNRSRFGQASDELDEDRVRFLWMELDHARLDPTLALEIARDPDYRYTTEHRLALAQRKHLPVDVRIALAANRSTPSQVLVRLAEDPDASVRIAVGTNGALPEDARLTLLQDKDGQVRREVMVKGHFSADVVRSWDDDHESRWGLAERLEACVWTWGDKRNWDSEQVLRDLAGSPHPRTRAAVAMNSRTPLEVLERLATDHDASVRQAVDAALGYDAASSYYPHGDDKAFIWWWRRELDDDELARLAQSSVTSVRAAVATRLHGSDLTTLTHDADPLVRAAAAQNPSLGFADFMDLANDDDAAVQNSLAFAVLGWLGSRQGRPKHRRNWLDDEERVHPKIPRGAHYRNRIQIGMPRLGSWWMLEDEQFDQVAKVANAAIRRSAASYSGSYSSKNDGAWGTAFDFKLSPDSLALLTQDSDDSVRRAALSNTGPSAVRLASSAETPVAVLAGFARSTSTAVRTAVASNITASGPILANLTRDREDTVRAAVAANHATPSAALDRLSRDPSEAVVLALLGNENMPSAFFEEQVAREDYGEHERHRRLAGNPATPEHVLSRVAYSAWTDVRERVAKNPSAGSDTLDVLALDEHARVRKAAQSRRPPT